MDGLACAEDRKAQIYEHRIFLNGKANVNDFTAVFVVSKVLIFIIAQTWFILAYWAFILVRKALQSIFHTLRVFKIYLLKPTYKIIYWNPFKSSQYIEGQSNSETEIHIQIKCLSTDLKCVYVNKLFNDRAFGIISIE